MTSTEEHDHCLAPGCARPLRSKISRRRGYGSGCWRRIRSAATAGALAARLAAFTARQIEAARELIEDAGIVFTDEGLALTVSTDGTEVYETTPEACSCPAGKECYHMAAVIMVSPARPEAAPRRAALPAAA